MNRRSAEKPPLIVVSGSCVNFEEERPKIVEVLEALEMGARKKGEMECSSIGKKYLGWDFFYIYFSQGFVEALLQIYPDLNKQEANVIEDRFVIWLDKQFRKKALKYNLQLSDVPREQAHGFRLNPDNYRSDDWMERYR